MASLLLKTLTKTTPLLKGNSTLVSAKALSHPTKRGLFYVGAPTIFFDPLKEGHPKELYPDSGVQWKKIDQNEEFFVGGVKDSEHVEWATRVDKEFPELNYPFPEANAADFNLGGIAGLVFTRFVPLGFLLMALAIYNSEMRQYSNNWQERVDNPEGWEEIFANYKFNNDTTPNKWTNKYVTDFRANRV